MIHQDFLLLRLVQFSILYLEWSSLFAWKRCAKRVSHKIPLLLLLHRCCFLCLSLLSWKLFLQDPTPAEAASIASGRKNLPASGATGGGSGGTDGGRRVYVGNLAWTVKWQDLKDVCREHLPEHEVVRANVLMGRDGRSRGCAVVEFATAEGASAAIAQLQDLDVKGRQIFLREDRESGIGSGGPTSSSTTPRKSWGAPPSQAAPTKSAGAFQPGQTSATSAGGGDGDSSLSRRVYVGNLAYEVRSQDLFDHFQKAGFGVLRADVMMIPHSNRSKGCGIVELSTQEDARNAITTLHNSELMGRMVFVREDREVGTGSQGATSVANKPAPGTQLFVGNLSFSTTWQDLKDHFASVGVCEHAEVMKNSQGRSRGFGIVKMHSKEDADMAVQHLNGVELSGRPLEVRLDNKAR